MAKRVKYFLEWQNKSTIFSSFLANDCLWVPLMVWSKPKPNRHSKYGSSLRMETFIMIVENSGSEWCWWFDSSFGFEGLKLTNQLSTNIAASDYHLFLPLQNFDEKNFHFHEGLQKASRAVLLRMIKNLWEDEIMKLSKRQQKKTIYYSIKFENK